MTARDEFTCDLEGGSFVAAVCRVKIFDDDGEFHGSIIREPVVLIKRNGGESAESWS